MAGGVNCAVLFGSRSDVLFSRVYLLEGGRGERERAEILRGQNNGPMGSHSLCHRNDWAKIMEEK